MRQLLLWTFTVAAVVLWGAAAVMALLEVVHLAYSEPAEHAAGLFALQAVVLAVLFTVAGRATARSVWTV